MAVSQRLERRDTFSVDVLVERGLPERAFRRAPHYGGGGELDALSFVVVGVTRVVSVPNGAVLDKAGEGEIDPMRDTAFRYLRNGNWPRSISNSRSFGSTAPKTSLATRSCKSKISSSSPSERSAQNWTPFDASIN
jgi:hypothetical protein